MSDSTTKGLLFLICVLLGGNAYFQYQADVRAKASEAKMTAAAEKRAAILQQLSEMQAKVEKQRTEIMATCATNLEENSNGIYQQIYHLNSATLKMENLAIQQREYLVTLKLAER